MTQKTAFIGLGVMGYPMAGHLAKAGHDVTVYNRTRSKAENWFKEYGGRLADTPAKAAEGADVVMSCVGNDDDVRSIVYDDDGAFAGIGKGKVFVDHTTASAELARELNRAARDRGFHFLDAPVSGGQMGAKKGVLAVMVGGDERALAQVQPTLQAYSRTVSYMGPAGSGQLTKMVNQICIAVLVQGLAEGLNFAVRAGLNGKKVVEVLSKGAAQSWQMDNRALTMLEDKFDFGFAVEWMHKDLGMCLEEGRNNGALLPAVALVDQFYAQINARGGRRWDQSSLIRLLSEP